MTKESLETTRELIISALKDVPTETKQEKIDNAELMLNLYHFLDPDEYDDNIKTLVKYKKK